MKRLLTENETKFKRNNMAQDLRDNTGKLIGRIHTLSNDKLEIRNASGRKLGTYDPGTNQTRDHTGRLVGKGNLLTMLLKN